jgi:hypothetical protein
MIPQPAKEAEITVVTQGEVESTARKLTEFIGKLPEKERAVMGWVMERAAAAPCWFPPPQVPVKPHFPHNHHTVVLSGQADGILVTFTHGGIDVGGPIGPGPGPGGVLGIGGIDGQGQG